MSRSKYKLMEPDALKALSLAGEQSSEGLGIKVRSKQLFSNTVGKTMYMVAMAMSVPRELAPGCMLQGAELKALDEQEERMLTAAAHVTAASRHEGCAATLARRVEQLQEAPHLEWFLGMGKALLTARSQPEPEQETEKPFHVLPPEPCRRAGCTGTIICTHEQVRRADEGATYFKKCNKCTWSIRLN